MVTPKRGFRPLNVGNYAIVLVVVWTLVIVLSWYWYQKNHHEETIQLAHYVARSHFDKDYLYRCWNSYHGGVYVPVTEETKPNPYIPQDEVPFRDLNRPDGQQVTLVNPAYMTRQVHELDTDGYQIRSHTTSLKPIRPENKATPWEAEGLKALAKGEKEYWNIVENEQGTRELRFIRPLFAEASCLLTCHGDLDYEVGDIRGGISVTVPLLPFQEARQDHLRINFLGHLGGWLLGLIGIALGSYLQWQKIRQRTLYGEEREKLIEELQEALTEIKTLQGILPVCSRCKKIRTEEGSWQLMENYVSQHSEAVFSHTLCEPCEDELYGDEDWYKKRKKS